MQKSYSNNESEINVLTCSLSIAGATPGRGGESSYAYPIVIQRLTPPSPHGGKRGLKRFNLTFTRPSQEIAARQGGRPGETPGKFSGTCHVPTYKADGPACRVGHLTIH